MHKTITILIFYSLLFTGCGGPQRTEEDESDADLIPPVLLNKIPLKYPEKARLDGLEGNVGLYIYVDSLGDVIKTRIRSSSNHPQLDEAAEKYVSQFKFKPARKGEENVGIWLSYKIDYSLRKTAPAFDMAGWLDKVSGLLNSLNGQNRARSEQMEEQLLDLYDRYCSYINMNPEINLNGKIDQILSKPSREKWQKFYDLCSLTFVLYDDLLKRLPEMRLADKTRSMLMIMVEQDIQRAAAINEKKIGGPRMFNEFVKTMHEFLNTDYVGNHPQRLDLILETYQQR